MKLKIRHAAVMRLRAGDVVIVELDNFDLQAAAYAEKAILRKLPEGVQVLVTSPDVSMKVMRREVLTPPTAQETLEP
jgi:hypothetical protein